MYQAVQTKMLKVEHLFFSLHSSLTLKKKKKLHLFRYGDFSQADGDTFGEIHFEQMTASENSKNDLQRMENSS